LLPHHQRCNTNLLCCFTPSLHARCPIWLKGTQLEAQRSIDDFDVMLLAVKPWQCINVLSLGRSRRTQRQNSNVLNVLNVLNVTGDRFAFM
jgi:hypothetical protein